MNYNRIYLNDFHNQILKTYIMRYCNLNLFAFAIYNLILIT